ncbi:reverse transcriptase domain-containing protein [Tanacetum coccineum]
METELWNLTMKGNDLAAYSQRFQELTMLCTKMVLEEEDRVEKFIGGLPENIQGNGYAVRNAKNKRRFDNNPKDNRVQQPPYKRQNVGGRSVARAYMAGNNEKKGYDGPLPYCNKCKLHHEGPCTMKCGKCNKVGHMARDFMNDVAATATQRSPVVNQRVPTCFECGRQGHYKNECPKNQTRGNKAGNKTNEAKEKAYMLGGGEANPDFNVVTVLYLMSSPLRYGRVTETNTVLRGCTLGLLGHPFNIDLMPIELGSFDVIIGMDWLANHHAVIVCDEKIVRISYGDEVLIVQENVEPKQIILDPDDQPMWESARTVAPTPNSVIVQLDVDDNFVINNTHLNMIRENKFDGYLWADPHDHIHEPTKGILDITAGGIFLYKIPNQAFRFLKDKVIFKHDWPIKFKNKHHRKSVSFADGSDSNTNNSRFMEKLKAMDSQIISLNEELQDIRNKYNELRNGNASKNHMNDDTPICECHEANYIQSEDYQNLDSHNSFSRQSHYDPNDSEKSLTVLNNDVRNDLKDFKRRIRSMRIVHWKLHNNNDGKTVITIHPYNTRSRGMVK